MSCHNCANCAACGSTLAADVARYESELALNVAELDGLKARIGVLNDDISSALARVDLLERIGRAAGALSVRFERVDGHAIGIGGPDLFEHVDRLDAALRAAGLLEEGKADG